MPTTEKQIKTISYQFTKERYDLIKALAKKENRNMRNMLFHALEFYIKSNDIKL